MLRKTTLAVVFLGLAAGWARADDKAFKVPFDTLKTQHMVIMVKINGKGPYRLIFDTGAPVTLLNQKVAKESGVLPKDAKVAPIPIFGGEMPQYKMKVFEVGDLKAENLSTMVMDHPTVAAIDKALGPVEGIVGLSFFGKYKMTIDYQAKEMTFVPVDFSPPDAMKSMAAVMLNPEPKIKVLAPAGQWGLRVGKDAKDENAGVNVLEVLPGSAAAKAGLQKGDRLLTVDGRWTDSVVDCYLAATFVRPGTSARLMILRNGKETELTVKVASGL